MALASTPGKGPRTSIQNGSAHLFVPYSAGTNARSTADDTRKPGAYFRLGGYSGIETAAIAADSTQPGSGDNLANFYPRQHLKDSGANAVEFAAGEGSSYKGGIMLSCDGRMLLRAGEKFYLHSKSAMHVDTESTLTVYAADAIKVQSAVSMTLQTDNAGPILITADGGKGSITQKSVKSLKEVNGNDYTYVTADSYTYTKADSYSYRLGRQESVTLGGTLSLFIGGTMAVNVGATLSIKLAYDATIYLGKLDLGITKIDFCTFKTEIKAGKIETTATNVTSTLVTSGLNAIEAKTGAITAISNGIDNVKAGIEARMNALSNHLSGLFMVT